MLTKLNIVKGITNNRKNKIKDRVSDSVVTPDADSRIFIFSRSVAMFSDKAEVNFLYLLFKDTLLTYLDCVVSVEPA